MSAALQPASALPDPVSPRREAASALPSAGPSPDPLESLRSALIERVLRLTPGGGLHTHPLLPGLMMFRSDDPSDNICGVYEPCVALILQGSKRVVLGGDTLVYDSGRYLIASLDLPAVTSILDASPARPYLSLALRLDPRDITGLLLGGHLPPVAEPRDGRAMATGALSLPLVDAFRRLVELTDEPASVPALAPLVMREIFYRLLTGELGGLLRRIAVAGSQGHSIARAIDRLKHHYAEPLRVEDLARGASMSVSTFHHHFKALTAMSPLQFQKQLRLTEARRLMLAEHLDASTAAFRVGYESASQFSREYSRQFGAPPMRDITVLRAAPQAALNP